MLLQLPTFNAVLNPCPVDKAAFTPHPAGSFCGQCQRVVQDFSQSANPVAALAAARAASADGRVCGSFRRAQVAPAPTLPRRLRWFLVALVLVVGQGLTAREALAQVRKPVPHRPTTPSKKRTPVTKKRPVETAEVSRREEEMLSGEAMVYPDTVFVPRTGDEIYTFAEQPPELPGIGGTTALVAYIQQRVQYPQALRNGTEGRLYVSFIVGKDGLVREAEIIKGLDPLLDAEALRVVRALPAFTPGRQGGKAVAVRFTLPIKFEAK